MAALSRADLWSLEDYADRRVAFRTEVLQRKRQRQVHLGPHVTLSFEDRVTIKYQVQEMLRIERIFERAAIQEELDAYNPLIPDGTNLKATMLIQYEDVDERRDALARLRGIEDRVWVRFGDSASAWAIADEDLDRENEEKTSAVHFLRFEFDLAARTAARAGSAMSAGVDHPHYQRSVDPVPADIATCLAEDFAGEGLT